MIAYLDASALAKLYGEEPGSVAVRDLLRRCLPATSRLSAVEVSSALARRCREGTLAPAERDRLLDDLSEDLTVLYLVEVVPEVVTKARSLLLRYSLRAADAVQLASGLVLQEKIERSIVFAAYDQRLLETVRREGLEVFASEDSA